MSTGGYFQFSDGEDAWQRECAKHYRAVVAEHKPALRCVAFLVFSGITRASAPGAFAYYGDQKMLVSYANAFQVHQRPLKTAWIHRPCMEQMPYALYLWLVALPVDVVAHTWQFFVGEGRFVFEGGVWFPLYMALHWWLLSCAFLGVFIAPFPATWDWYFAFLTRQLLLNDRCYVTALRTRRTAVDRALHFVAFLALCAIAWLALVGNPFKYASVL
jgi:hypothetical protein